jgi:hypothetical protein
MWVNKWGEWFARGYRFAHPGYACSVGGTAMNVSLIWGSPIAADWHDGQNHERSPHERSDMRVQTSEASPGCRFAHPGFRMSPSTPHPLGNLAKFLCHDVPIAGRLVIVFLQRAVFSST